MLRLVIKRNGGGALAPAEQLLEVITPRTNAALITPAENLCGSLTLETATPGNGPVALEIVADGERNRFFVRTERRAQQRRLQGQIGAAYPQATLRALEPASMPSGDPLHVGSDEQIACCALALRDRDYLPIRTFHDRDLDADSGAPQADPVLGILRALDDLPQARGRHVADARARPAGGLGRISAWPSRTPWRPNGRVHPTLEPR